MGEILALRSAAGPLEGRLFPRTPGVEAATIGRDHGNSIAIPSNSVSRFHCRIEPDAEGAWVIIDLQSRNRTRVNGEAVERRRRETGGEISVGTTQFSVVPAAPMPAAELDDEDDTAPLDGETMIEARSLWLERVLSGGLWCKILVGPNSVAADVSIEPDADHAANAARQISGIVALDPPSLPNLNCPFLIFSASSIPLITMVADSKLLSPSIGHNRCLILR